MEFGTYYLYLQIMERMTMKTRHIEMVTNRTRNADISGKSLIKVKNVFVRNIYKMMRITSIIS